MIKAISFDLDGTLVDRAFDDAVWLEEIPKMYAEKHKIPFKDAQDKVFANYYRGQYIEELPFEEWTNIEYWMKRFGLGDWKKLVTRLKKHVFVYDDVYAALASLHKKYKLIVVSNAHENFLQVKLEAEKLKEHFDHIYSCPSEFGLKKSKPVFQKILQRLKLKPEEIVHVGDDHDGDYLTPRELGMRAFHLLRGRKRTGKYEITSLKGLSDKIKQSS